MDVIGVTTYYYWVAFKIITDTTQILMKFGFNGGFDKGFTVLRTEDNVKIIFYEGLAHNDKFYTTVIITPLQGFSFSNAPVRRTTSCVVDNTLSGLRLQI